MSRVLILLFLFACSSKNECPNALLEPVSVCRAKVACNTRSPFTFIGIVLGGFGSSKSGRNEVYDSVNLCVEQNLSAQRANAGIQDSHKICIVREIASDTYQTDCN